MEIVKTHIVAHLMKIWAADSFMSIYLSAFNIFRADPMKGLRVRLNHNYSQTFIILLSFVTHLLSGLGS